MSIESQIPTQEINIKDLSLNPEADAPFNINRILKPEMIEWVRQQTSGLAEKEKQEHDEANAEYLYELNACLKIIDPGKAVELGDKTWDNIVADIKYFQDNIRDLLIVLSSAKILFPEKYQKLNVDLDSVNQKFALYLNDAFREKYKTQEMDIWDVSQMLWYIKIIFPKISDKILTEPEWQVYIKNIEESRQYDGGNEISAFAVILKIYRPDLLVKINLNRKDWKSIESSMSDSLEVDRGNMVLGVEMIKAKMLAADKINFTDHGPEAIFNSLGLEPRSPSVPEIKKF